MSVSQSSPIAMIKKIHFCFSGINKRVVYEYEDILRMSIYSMVSLKVKKKKRMPLVRQYCSFCCQNKQTNDLLLSNIQYFLIYSILASYWHFFIFLHFAVPVKVQQMEANHLKVTTQINEMHKNNVLHLVIIMGCLQTCFFCQPLPKL